MWRASSSFETLIFESPPADDTASLVRTARCGLCPLRGLLSRYSLPSLVLNCTAGRRNGLVGPYGMGGLSPRTGCRLSC